MPTVDCDMIDCKHHGTRDSICVHRRIELTGGRCLSYAPGVSKTDLDAFNPHCRKDSAGKYKSNRVKGVLR